MQKKTIKKTDICILLVLIVVNILVKMPLIEYPIAGDSTIFLNLAESIYYNQTYNYQGEPHTTYPPIWPLSVSIFLPFTKNPVFAMKIAGSLMSTITIVLLYILAKRIGLKTQAAAITSALLLFNPMFQYYGGGYFNVAESVGTLLFLLAGYFFITKNERPRNEYLFAGVLGISLIAKVDLMFFAIPFVLYYAYLFFKNREFKDLMMPAIIVLPLAIWVARNFSIIGSVTGKEYSTTWGMKLLNTPESTLRLAIAGFLTVTFLTPFIIYGLKKHLEKDSTKFWSLFTAGMILHVALFIIIDSRLTDVDFVAFTVMRTRRFILALPWLTLISVSSIRFLKPKFQRLAKTIIIAILTIFFIMMITYNYGQVQDKIGAPLGSTYSLRSYHRVQIIDWINDNLPEDSTLYINYYENMNYNYIGKHFREDIDVKTGGVPEEKEYYILTDSGSIELDDKTEEVKKVKTTAVYRISE